MRVKYDKSSDLYIKYMAYVLRILVRPRRDPLEPQYPDGRRIIKKDKRKTKDIKKKNRLKL